MQKGWEVSGNSKLSLTSIPVEWPNSGEVLIRIKAAGICGSDLAQLNETSIAPLKATSILGLEIAGEIIAVGSDVELWAEGDRVCCLLSGGGFAEFCNCPACYCLPIPNGFSWNEAAAIPMGITTGAIFGFNDVIGTNSDLNARLGLPFRNRQTERRKRGFNSRCIRRSRAHPDTAGKGFQFTCNRDVLKP